MNCPMHNLIFRSRGRSYRELPLRLFEFGTVYRYEKSGVVHGLTRVRGLTRTTRTSTAPRSRCRGELRAPARRSCSTCSRDYGLDDFYLELSTRDDSPKFVGADEDWEEATEALRAGRRASPAWSWCPTRAARRSTARRSPCRPGRDRPDLADVDHPGRLQPAGAVRAGVPGGRRHPAAPVMIHRALFGSIERFFGVLTEHYAGAFPAWLAPVQVVGIPIRDDHVAYLQSVRGRAAGSRASGSRSTPPTTGCRRRSAPRSSRRSRSWCIAGDEDVAAGAVSFRYRDGSQRNGVPLDEAVAHVVEVVAVAGQHRPVGRPRRTRAPDRTAVAVAERGMSRGAGRSPAAVDAAPDGVHQGRGRPTTADGCPFCAAPGWRRGRARRRPRRARATRCSTCTRTTPAT